MEPAPKPKERRKRCKNCKKLFPITKPNRIFCSVGCKNIHNRFGPGYDAVWKKLTLNLSRTIETAVHDRYKLLLVRMAELEARMEKWTNAQA